MRSMEKNRQSPRQRYLRSLFIFCVLGYLIIDCSCYTYEITLRVIRIIKQEFERENNICSLISENSKQSLTTANYVMETLNYVRSSKLLSNELNKSRGLNQQIISFVTDKNAIATTDLRPMKLRSMTTENIFISLNFQGRLGNLLFEFATLYGISMELNLVPVVDQHFVLRKIFNLDAISTQKIQNPKVYNEKKGCVFEKEALDIDVKHNWTLNGYFQSWKYFSNHSKTLKQLLTFQEHIQQEADKQFSQIMAAHNIVSVIEKTLVAVHVRLEDMFHPGRMTQFGYKSSDINYIHRAMAMFQSIFSNVIFVVASDDLGWCRFNLKMKNVVFIAKTNPPELDVAILTKCNHTIITTGSYGWWIAWLIDGRTIYDKSYPKVGSALDTILKSDDYRPSNWLPM